MLPSGRPASGANLSAGATAGARRVILAVDPSLRGTGYAVLISEGPSRKIRAVTYGVVSNPARLPHEACLLAIHDTLLALMDAHHPSGVAIESVIYVQSFRTAIVLGSARGAVLLAAARRGLPIHEYAPRRVKQAVVGRGGAQKQQVGFMVRALLGLEETPPPDAADAIAVGLAHHQASRAS